MSDREVAVAGRIAARPDWSSRPAGVSGARVRAVVQRGFLSPDQRGGQAQMWANVLVLWALRCSEPPRAVGACGDDKVGLWLTCDAHAGVADGQRVLMDDEVWRVDQVRCGGAGAREMWLRLVHDGAKA